MLGQRRARRDYHLTTEGDEQPPERPWVILTPLPGTITKTGGHTYGLRPWIAYGVKQRQNERGGLSLHRLC
jgi:hypothetical protein